MTLYPKKSSAIVLLLVCVAFVVMGLWLARSHGWMGYLCAGFFSLGIPLAIIRLLPGSTYLEIEEEGLTISEEFRKTLVPLNVIDEFFVVKLKRTGVTVHKMVGFNFVQSYDRSTIGRGVAKAFSECEGALPDTYGMKAEELAELLNSKLLKFRETNGRPIGQPDDGKGPASG